MSCYNVKQGVPASVKLTLTRHGNLVNLANTATVTVAITNEATLIPELASISASPTEDGADWSQGLIVIVLTANQTAQMDLGVYGVSVKAVDGSDNYYARDPYAIQVDPFELS